MSSTWPDSDCTVMYTGRPCPGRYKATREKDGYLYVDIRFGSIRTRKYVRPEDVTFKKDVKKILVEKVGPHGEV